MEGGRRTFRDDVHIYWRRYLDEAVWEPVDAGVVEHALSDVYRDVSLAMDFLREAGSIRTAAAMFEAEQLCG